MQAKKPTRKQEAKQFAALLQAANNQTKAAEFWGQLFIGVTKTCWERMTGEKLPEGLVHYIMTVCEDAIKKHGQEGIKFEGLVAAAYEQFMQARPDKMSGEAVKVTEVVTSTLVTPAQALEEVLGGEPLVVLK